MALTRGVASEAIVTLMNEVNGEYFRVCAAAIVKARETILICLWRVRDADG